MSGIQYGLGDLLQMSFEYHKGTGRIKPGTCDIVRIKVGDTPLDHRMKMIGGLVKSGIASAILTITPGIGLAVTVTKGTVAVAVVNRKACSSDTSLIFSVTEFVYDKHDELTRLFEDAVAVYQLKGSRRKTSKWRLVRDKVVDSGTPEVGSEDTQPAVSAG